MLGLTSDACGTSAASPARATPPAHAAGSTASPKSSGVADVAYAGSLELLDEKVIGPAFSRATGASYEGRGGGSIGLANEIADGEITPNVFESIGARPIEMLEPKHTSWYVQLAASPLVVAYNPSSPYAPALRAIAEGREPLSRLFSVMGSPGFLLGRTNPGTDPQGQAFYEMVELARSELHLPADTIAKVLGSVDNPSEVFAETALDSRLEAGELDAASAFMSQAVQLHLPYVALPSSIDFGDPALAPSYAKASVELSGNVRVHGVPLVVDATTIGRDDERAADAFVSYLLSDAGRSAFRRDGYEVLTPKLFGDLRNVPPSVRRAVGG